MTEIKTLFETEEHHFCLETSQYKPLLAVVKQPERKFYFKEQEITEEAFNNIMRDVMGYLKKMEIRDGSN